jgi:hypothetical protein
MLSDQPGKISFRIWKRMNWFTLRYFSGPGLGLHRAVLAELVLCLRARVLVRGELLQHRHLARLLRLLGEEAVRRAGDDQLVP